MSDESVRLSLRIHDEVRSRKRNDIWCANISSAMGATSSGPTFAHAARISYLASKKLLKRHRMVAVA